MEKLSDTARIPELNQLMTDIDQCIAYNKHASDPMTLNDYIETYQSLVGK